MVESTGPDEGPGDFAPLGDIARLIFPFRVFHPDIAIMNQPTTGTFRSLRSLVELVLPSTEQNVQMWKMKRLIKSLEAARGCALGLPQKICC